ncbi:hypothetical protein [Microbacterium trichothecenolyticum]|uniref:Uncharacterized protein n=1 Tax=Microbacterium trichothecenolyticum TaxID=69370 RepID=A0ABU0TUT9_MICTR|nr:hypothetical protein [Microbacterium trichothecenolyticum]MDQ1123425.1 hypothetical protein [Microbacterium trichothecenolyticum]
MRMTIATATMRGSPAPTAARLPSPSPMPTASPMTASMPLEAERATVGYMLTNTPSGA